MSITLNDDGLKQITEVVAGAIRERMESHIREAVRSFEIELRKDVGRIAINMSNNYTIERLGPEMIIRVIIDKKSGAA